MTYQLTSEQQLDFERTGYLLLKDVFSPDMVEALRSECDRFMQEKDAELDMLGTDHHDLTFRGQRYFFSQKLKQSPIIEGICFSETMRAIARALLGPETFLFLDQFVVKGPESEIPFSWHQDSGYIPYQHKPYLTCWMPLDDVDEANGTVYLLSYDEAGGRVRVEHRQDEALNDQVGYHGPLPGTPAILKAGDLALFSSTTFHRSDANQTPKLRRVFLMQYTAEPIHNPDGRPRHWAEPLN
jgi:ectoine hydroxylase-related dioxygenase (phytanoyl-CoA dioxygenase family)